MMPVGMTILQSSFSPKVTMDRFVSAAGQRGMMIIARIDHAAAAATVGLKLRPTEIVIFGDPRTGTPLMQASQTTGIDLPLRALVFTDGEGMTWLAYNDPSWIADRHGITLENIATLTKMSEGLALIAKTALAVAA